MAHLLPTLKQQFSDSNGDPLSGGKVYTYEAGTSTPLATYTDQSEAAENANPIILDANGEADIWIGSGSYKFVITDADDVVLDTKDDVTYIGVGDVVTESLANGAVTTVKIADGAVTQDKLAAKVVETQELTIGTITSSTPAAQTGTCTIDTTGRPVHVSLRGQDDSGTPAYFKLVAPKGTQAMAQIDFYRDATKIMSQTFGVKTDTGSALLDSFTSAGADTFTPSRSGTVILVGAGGGGGGGGGPSTNGGGGGGGAGGECGTVAIAVTAGSEYAVTIGAGGTGGTGNGNGPGNPGASGGETTISLSGTVLARWKGGAGGSGGTGSSGSGGAGGAGYKAGGSGGAGGAGSAGTGSAGTEGGQAIGGYASGGAVLASVPSGGNGGGGGGGGGSLGTGGDGQRNNLSGMTAGTLGGGGGGAAGAASSAQQGASGGSGALYIYDGGAGSGGTVEAYVPVSAFSIIDIGANEATHNYTLQLSVSDEDATLTAEGVVSLEAREL